MTFLRAIVAGVLCLLASQSYATQKTKAQLTTQITSTLPSSGAGQITAAILRAMLQDMVDSSQQINLLNQQTGTTYTLLASDQGKLVTFNNALPVAVTLPQGIGDFGAGYNLLVQNLGAGAVTITPTLSTINGAATLVLNQNQVALIVSGGLSVYRSITYGLMSSVTCGSGLSGGVITTTGTCSITDTISSNSSVGSTTTVPVISFNSRGQLTTVTTATISAGGIGALLAANNLSDLTNTTTARSNLGVAIGTNVQAWDSDLDAVAGLTGTGVAARTTTGSWATRSITGTSAQINVSNGDGVSGNPTLSLADTIASGGPTGSATLAPVITYDAKGRLTAVTSAAIAPPFSAVTGQISLSQLPTIGTNTILSNVTTGSTTPLANSLSSIIDTITNGRGSILYRDASNWTFLAPGVAGQVLSTNGAGTDPSYISVAGTGTVTTITQGRALTFSTNPITTAGTISADVATDSNNWSATADKLVDSAGLNTSGNPVTITQSISTITLNLASGVDFNVTLTTTPVFANPTVTSSQLGRTGCIWITQPTTTFYAISSFGSNWKFASGTAPTLTTTASAVDVLCYKARTTSFIWGVRSGADIR